MKHLISLIPAPVAPAQGTAASTTATDKFDWRRNWRAMVNPITPAPTMTTSNDCVPDPETRFDPDILRGLDLLAE